MEYLKPFDELLLPDSRQANFSIRDVTSGAVRPFDITDSYTRASVITLHEGVPTNVRTHFATALNLLAYSWFFYPLNVTAQFMAYISVETALRTRYSVTRRTTFRMLVERAVREGLVKDSGFTHLRDSMLYYPLPELEFFEMAAPDAKPYVETLLGSIPYLRNDLAHGSTMLHMNGASHVQVCADFINQLFPLPNDG